MGKLESKIHFYRTLAYQIEAGVPLIKALRSVGRSKGGKIAKKIAAEIESTGESLCRSMSAVTGYFTEYEISLVEASELTGGLDSACRRLADIFERRKKFKSELISALTYPAMLYFVASVLLPFISYMVGGKSEFRMCAEIIGMLSMPFVFLLIIQILNNSGKSVKRILYTVSGAFPVLGKVSIFAGLADFFEIYGTCIQSGVDAVKSIRTACSACRNPALAKKLAPLANIMDERGCAFSEAVVSRGGLPGILEETELSIIMTGEETGRVPETSFIISGKYEERARSTVSILARIVPFVIYIMMVIYIANQIISLFAGIIRKTTAF